MARQLTAELLQQQQQIEVDSDEEGVGVLDRIRVWLPVLLALSANSPFWQGRGPEVQRSWADLQDRGTGAERQRRVAEESGDPADVVRQAVLAYGGGLLGQRPPATRRVAPVT